MIFKMDSKGQNQVFQLLIGAIIAFAVLAILLGLLPNINIGKNPLDEAKRLVKDAANNPSSAFSSERVTFDNAKSLVPRTIAVGSGGVITEDQLCLFTGSRFDEGSGFEFRGDKPSGIYYTGSPREVKLRIICDRPSALEKGLKDNFPGETFTLGGASCGNDCESSGRDTCCVIVVVGRDE